jgi:hypothetical protein
MFTVTIKLLTDATSYNRSTWQTTGIASVFHVIYTIHATHLVLSSMDSQYMVMTALVITGLLTTIRYDTGEALMANLISLLTGFTFFVTEHIHDTDTEKNLAVMFQQQLDENLYVCDNMAAVTGLFIGGAWFILPLVMTTSRVYTGEHAYSLSMSFITVLCLIPLQLQIFRPDQAWIPFLFPQTHVNMLKQNIGSSIENYYMTVTIVQNILILVSCIVNTWLLLAQPSKTRPSKTWFSRALSKTNAYRHTQKTEFFVVSMFLTLLWASFMVNLGFKQLLWVYITTLGTSLLCITYFTVITI